MPFFFCSQERFDTMLHKFTPLRILTLQGFRGAQFVQIMLLDSSMKSCQ